jgi:hypothetical protein
MQCMANSMKYSIMPKVSKIFHQVYFGKFSQNFSLSIIATCVNYGVKLNEENNDCISEQI